MNKPNVLIILTDQQRFDTVSAAGYTHMKTPNLDKLVEEGLCFSCAHSGNPVCMPARHDLITGFPARIHGYYGNAEKQRIRDYSVPTIARIFSDNDYRTVAIGKMHFSPVREHHGFDEMQLMEELPKIRQQDEYAMYLKNEGYEDVQNLHGVRPHIYHIPQNSMVDEKYHETTWVADRVNQWIDDNKENPFFMMCGFIKPHPPWNIPKEFDGLYDDIKIPKSIQKSRLPFECSEDNLWYGDMDSEEEKEKIRKAYYTSISMVDKSVGRIIEKLRETGKLDNTLIIYTSDHGEMLQDKGYYSKELPYDSAVRIPMIIRYPKRATAGEKSTKFVDLLDVLPTCLDVCGIEYPSNGRELFGKSMLKNEKKEYQVCATGNKPLRWVMARNSKYKYIYHYMGAYEELYETDKDEVVNLIKDGVKEDLLTVYTDLKSKALEYEAQWGIEGGVENGEFTFCESERIHPSVRGKYHLWSNHQMQEFCKKENRGKRLEFEMEKAVQNYDKSGVLLKDVFNDIEWKQDFIDCYKEYTNDEFTNFPFK